MNGLELRFRLLYLHKLQGWPFLADPYKVAEEIMRIRKLLSN